MNKNSLLLFVFFVSAIGCRSKLSIEKRQNNFKLEYIESFKTLIFCRCLYYGFNQTAELLSRDASCKAPDYLTQDIFLIDSLAKNKTKKIINDSINSVGNVAEGMEGKMVISHCLQFYTSKSLDSIAVKRYEYYLKSFRK